MEGCDELQKRLFSMSDKGNAAFMAKLTPNVDPSLFLGIRVPGLRALEKEIRGSSVACSFLENLPHKWFDENLLHSIILSNVKDYGFVVDAVEAFLPYVDNWAVCDTLRPAVFKRHVVELLPLVKNWISSTETYTCRFGVGILMAYYLDDCFDPSFLELPAAVHSNEYYVNMMIAWFYATALAKQWDRTIGYLQGNVLDAWVHNKTIQKAIESYRITTEQKAYLRGLKRK